MALVNQTDYAGFKRALIAWADGVLGTGRTGWANTDFPKLARPYGLFHITSMGADQGLDERVEVLNGLVLETTYLGLREMTMDFKIFAPAPDSFNDSFPQELLQEAIIRLSAQATIDAFRAVNLAFINHTPIVQADGQAGDRWEWAAQAGLNFSYRTCLFDDGLADPPDDGQIIGRVGITINDEPEFTVDIKGTGVFTPDFTPDFD